MVETGFPQSLHWPTANTSPSAAAGSVIARCPDTPPRRLGLGLHAHGPRGHSPGVGVR